MRAGCGTTAQRSDVRHCSRRLWSSRTSPRGRGGITIATVLGRHGCLCSCTAVSAALVAATHAVVCRGSLSRARGSGGRSTSSRTRARSRRSSFGRGTTRTTTARERARSRRTLASGFRGAHWARAPRPMTDLQQSPAVNLDAINVTTTLLAQYFPDVPVLPTLGMCVPSRTAVCGRPRGRAHAGACRREPRHVARGSDGTRRGAGWLRAQCSHVRGSSRRR